MALLTANESSIYFELVLVDVFRIGYIIEVTANFLAVYHNSELLIYRVTPAVECGTVELVSVTEIFIPRPAVGKILMGNLYRHDGLCRISQVYF